MTRPRASCRPGPFSSASRVLHSHRDAGMRVRLAYSADAYPGMTDSGRGLRRARFFVYAARGDESLRDGESLRYGVGREAKWAPEPLMPTFCLSMYKNCGNRFFFEDFERTVIVVENGIPKKSQVEPSHDVVASTRATCHACKNTDFRNFCTGGGKEVAPDCLATGKGRGMPPQFAT